MLFCLVENIIPPIFAIVKRNEIVFSSLYKFCEGMLRCETRYSHFFCSQPDIASLATPTHPSSETFLQMSCKSMASLSAKICKAFRIFYKHCRKFYKHCRNLPFARQCEQSPLYTLRSAVNFSFTPTRFHQTP